MRFYITDGILYQVGYPPSSDPQNIYIGIADDSTQVAIPDGVTSIGRCSFSGWRTPESVVIPDSVTFIGRMVFSGCRSLVNISLPDNIAAISDKAFQGCFACCAAKS